MFDMPVYSGFKPDLDIAWDPGGGFVLWGQMVDNQGNYLRSICKFVHLLLAKIM